uniref:Translation elongation factor EF1B beta/delta subunit guanine nucleotide exchange domain-containing protein n=1 Tax=Oryza meridionalis TaxID=40149 RepID=A0A0E0D1Y3_9ORYZ
MAITLSNVNSEAGLQKLDEYLLTRSYISGYQASKDDMTVFTSLPSAPAASYFNVTRWYDHISALLRSSGVTAEGEGVKVESTACSVSPTADQKAPAADEEDDDDVDLFGEETEEEKKAAEERAAAVKASGKKKEYMAKLEEAVRNVKMEGLLWAKLVPVGYGIKKLQIMMTIVDDLVSVDSLIEDHFYTEPANEFIQSCDIVAFNKIFRALAYG